MRDQIEALQTLPASREVKHVVLTVGVNDTLNENFSAELRNFLDLCRQKGIRVLFVEEPGEGPIHENLAKRQTELADVARLQGVPHISLQNFLDERADDGFLWWDFVHLSDKGAELVAGAMFQPVHLWLQSKPGGDEKNRK